MKVKTFLKAFGKVLSKVSILLLIVGIESIAFAGPSGTTSNITISNIQTNLGSSVTHLAVILQDISLVAGLGFVMASFFKFHQHKLNPTQVPISQGITLLLIGAGLLLFPALLPTATKAAFGTAAISKVSGGAIKGLIS